MTSSPYGSSFGNRLTLGLGLATAAAVLFFSYRRRHHRLREPAPSSGTMADQVDEEIAESFPASDPPSHTPTSGARP